MSDHSIAESRLSPVPPKDGRGVRKSALRRRLLAGLLVVLPFAITFWAVYQLYLVLERHVIGPAARLVRFLANGDNNSQRLPPWFDDYVAPMLGSLGVLVILYVLGYAASWRVFGLFDRLLARLPVVAVIHRAVRQMVNSLGGKNELSRFKRVVLVSFPHPGMRVPGFVTSSCLDVTTQKVILCVYVPTTPIPTSGYMILIPEDEVTDLDWNLEETLQAVVSFGLTAPTHVSYYRPSTARPFSAVPAPGKEEPTRLPGSDVDRVP